MEICKYLGRFHMLTVKACSETALFRERYITKILTDCNFRNSLAVTIIFSFKFLGFDVNSRNRTKKSKKVFYFSYNCICIGSGKFSQSWTGYLSSTINMLTNTSKISPNTRGDTFQINFNENDEKHDKWPLMEISKHLGRFHMLIVNLCSEIALFRERSNQDFHTL